MQQLSESELQQSLTDLNECLKQFKTGNDSLDVQLESASKHIPAYIKIVKSHISQLKSVLELENHNHKTLETAGLARPVKQLIEMFSILTDEDLNLIEEMAATTRKWQTSTEEEVTPTATVQESTTS